MKVKDLIEKLQSCNPNHDVVIPVELAYSTVGGSPCVFVEHVTSGFDWDAGSVFLDPSRDTKLTLMSREEYVDHIRYRQLSESIRGRREKHELSEIFVKKDFVIERLKRLLSVEELEPFEIADLITDITEEKL